MAENKQAPGIPDPTYQDKDIRLKPIVVSIILILACVALAMVSMRWLFNSYEAGYTSRRNMNTAETATRMLPPFQRLQVNEPADLAALRGWEDSMVNGYGETTNGTYRIPIDQAMKMALEKGFPVRESAD